jgi:hypothetical protein
MFIMLLNTISTQDILFDFCLMHKHNVRIIGYVKGIEYKQYK